MTTLLDLKSSVLRQVQRSQSLRSRREPPPTPSSPLRPRPEPLPRRWAHSCILPLKFFFFRSRNGLSSTNIPTAFKMKKNQPTEATVVPVFHQPQQQVVNSWRRCVLMSLLWAATLTQSVPRGDVDASLTCSRSPLKRGSSIVSRSCTHTLLHSTRDVVWQPWWGSLERRFLQTFPVSLLPRARGLWSVFTSEMIKISFVPVIVLVCVFF